MCRPWRFGAHLREISKENSVAAFHSKIMGIFPYRLNHNVIIDILMNSMTIKLIHHSPYCIGVYLGTYATSDAYCIDVCVCGGDGGGGGVCACVCVCVCARARARARGARACVTKYHCAGRHRMDVTKL